MLHPFFFFNDTATTEIYTLSLHDALPISAEFLARSPVRYADSVTTPLMFILGDADLRTPPTQGGEAMFRALKYLHRTTVQVRFPGESHELSRSGKPVHRVERLQHILNWFDKYLQGKPITQYDTR